jgi:hypothetical protein
VRLYHAFDRAKAGFSPGRVDALVWALTDLILQPMKGSNIYELYRENAEAAKQRNKPRPTNTNRRKFPDTSVPSM